MTYVGVKQYFCMGVYWRDPEYLLSHGLLINVFRSPWLSMREAMIFIILAFLFCPFSLVILVRVHGVHSPNSMCSSVCPSSNPCALFQTYARCARRVQDFKKNPFVNYLYGDIE